jgi:hypothetical protein
MTRWAAVQRRGRVGRKGKRLGPWHTVRTFQTMKAAREYVRGWKATHGPCRGTLRVVPRTVIVRIEP